MKKEIDILILGAGESGVGAAVLAKKQGFLCFVSDAGKIKKKYKDVLISEKIDWEEGSHQLAKELKVNTIIKSPGIPDNSDLVKFFLQQGKEVISEVEFAFRYCPSKIIAITGSNGKTTTTSLIGHMLKKAGLKVGIVGNVGNSFAWELAREEHDYYVVELSSFQLDGIIDFRAHINILLNITADHLDRYEYSFEKYAAAKLRIAKNLNQEDYFIYCEDDDTIINAIQFSAIQAKKIPFSIKKKLPEGAYIENEQLTINLNNNQLIMSIHDLALQGKHNLYNSMASGIAGRVLELRKDLIRESLSDFQNVEHRLERVATIHGIDFINDSKATNVNSTWYALESINQPIIWIVGGVDKGNNYDDLSELVKANVKAIICLGKDNSKIIQAFGADIEQIAETLSAEEAVRKAYEFGQKGDVVLLSPACASFDLFENYEDRGQQFKKAVRNL